MAASRIQRAIGVISGTSMDGIDVAVVETDGDRVVRPGPGKTFPYPAALRDRLFRLLDRPEIAETDPLEEPEEEVTAAFIAAVRSLMSDLGLMPRDVDLVGLHGQTIYHRPERRFTRQLGFGARLAECLGIDTVSRFRHADVAAGGQGAPLAPLYHRALAAAFAQPLMVLNLGGVANVTYLHGDLVIAFDTGPASALLDDFVQRRRGQPFDEDGRLAASGRADRALVEAFIAHPFFDRVPPKSLDRNDFHRVATAVEAAPDADGAATLAAFTIESVVASLRHVPEPPQRWLVGGGGRRNSYIMRELRHRLGVPVEAVEAVGWDGDLLEAQCFGYLAVRSAVGLPLTLPTTTGVDKPLCGGELHRAGR